MNVNTSKRYYVLVYSSERVVRDYTPAFNAHLEHFNRDISVKGSDSNAEVHFLKVAINYTTSLHYTICTWVAL